MTTTANYTNNEPLNKDIEFYTSINDVVKEIKKKYKNDKMDMFLSTQMQVADGSLVEFISTDENKPEVLASLRLRLKNEILIDKETHAICVRCYFTDLCYNKNLLLIKSQTEQPQQKQVPSITL